MLEAHGDPEQDNATFTIVKVLSERSRRLEIAAANEGEVHVNGTERQYAARSPSSSWLKSTLLTRGASLFRNPTQ